MSSRAPLRPAARPWALLLVVLGVLAGRGAAWSQAARWPAAGGADGSSSLEVPAVRRPPSTAWSLRLTGELEGEPLVWDRTVLVVTRERGGRRVLSLHDLASGRRLATQALAEPLAPWPSLYGDRVAVRGGVDRVDLLRVGGARLQRLRSFEPGGPVSAPVFAEGALLLRAGDDLFAYLLDRNAPAWRASGTAPFRGRPSVSEGVVFALRYLDRGVATLCLLDARDGSLLQAVACGDHDGAVPPPEAELDVAVLADEVFVRFPLPVRGSGGGAYDTARVALERTPAGPRLAVDPDVRLYALAAPPAGTGTGWLALETVDLAPLRWLARMRSRPDARPDAGLVLADGDAHARLLAAPAPAAVGGTVALLGDVAADVVTWDVLWRLPAPSLVRPVPCEPAPGVGGWLVAPASDRLTLLRGAEPARGPAAARALERVRSLAQREADALAELAQRAVASGDVALVARLVRAAVERGAATSGTPARALALAQDGLARLHASASRRVDERAVATFEAEAARVLARLPDELAREAATASDQALRRALLRELLARDPEHAGAAAAVRALLPADVPVGGGVFDAASWLDYLDVAARRDVRVERPPDGPGVDAVAQRLAREAAEWRADCVAYRTERLAVVTPAGRPGPVARALAVGELVCDVLEELFDAPSAAAGEPLVLLLYTDRDEYVAESQRDRSVPEVARGWTVGHFDPRDGLSRLYVPPGPDGVERMLSTFAHELAHHWLATRSPFAAAARRAPDRRERPGFWLVEGFASLVGELALDPATGAWSAADPRAESLDALANVDPAALLDWRALLVYSKADFDALRLEAVTRVALSWRLGGAASKSALNLFYDQAGALAHHLFAAEDGRHRAVLLDALRAYYTAEEPVDVARRLGTTPAALGADVRATARAAVGR